MSPDGPLQQLVSIAAEPSEDSWLALCRLIVGWPGQSNEVPVSRIDTLLENWPMQLRHINSDWSRLGYGGAAGPLGRLARCLTIYRRSDDAERHLARIATSPDLGAVQRLTIERSEISWPALAAFCGCAGLPSLTELTIKGVCLRSTAAPELPEGACLRFPVGKSADAPLLSHLKTLRANSCGLDDTGLTRWLQWLERGRLEILELRRNRLSDDALALLSDWPCLDALQELDLSDNPLTSAGRDRFQARWCRTGGLRM